MTTRADVITIAVATASPMAQASHRLQTIGLSDGVDHLATGGGTQGSRFVCCAS